MQRTLTLGAAVLCAAAIWSTPAAAAGAEWTQWGGPNRNFTVDAKGLANSWPFLNGPKKLWSRSLGEGYSAIACDGPVLYTMYRKGTQEAVIALEASTGKTLWEYWQEAPFDSSMDMSFGSGPHSTPLVAGDKVFAVGIRARLHALDKKTGKPLWSHDLVEEFHGEVHGRGYAVSPVAYKDTVIMKIGGPNGMIAFRQSDGAVAWKKLSFENSPATPLLATIGGQDQLIVFAGTKVMGVDPNNGNLLWEHPHQTQWELNISTPLVGPDNKLFISSAYTGGSRMLQLKRAGDKWSAAELWFTNRMRIHFGTAVWIGDYIYGSSGDFGPIPMTAIDARTGKIVWQDRGLAKSNFVYADGKLLAVCEDGDVALAAVSAEGLKVMSKSGLLAKTAWTAPTLVGTTLYLRDRKNIMAVNVGNN